MSDKKKFYIRENGELIFIPFNDEPAEITNEYIELDENEWKENSNLEWGKKRIVVDGVIRYVEDTEVTSTAEYREFKITNEIYAYQQYLEETDYIVTKLNEVKLESTEEEYENLKAQYIEKLAKRKEARTRINELEEELKSIQG